MGSRLRLGIRVYFLRKPLIRLKYTQSVCVRKNDKNSPEKRWEKSHMSHICKHVKNVNEKKRFIIKSNTYLQTPCKS